jgi:membrane protein DedA with SNARE-associated domain
VEQLLAILRDGTALVVTFGYTGVFLAMLVEGSGIPLPFPGALLLAFVGYTAWTGNLDVVQASLAGAAGLTVGAWLLYRVARNAGPLLAAKHGHRLGLTQEKLNGAQSWFRVHAGRATFFARMTPGARIYISIAAGLAHMQQALFVLATFAGTWIWCLALISVGWLLGTGWRSVTDVLSTLQTWFLVVVAGLAFALVLLNRRNGERNPKS